MNCQVVRILGSSCKVSAAHAQEHHPDVSKVIHDIPHQLFLEAELLAPLHKFLFSFAPHNMKASFHLTKYLALIPRWALCVFHVLCVLEMRQYKNKSYHPVFIEQEIFVQHSRLLPMHEKN